VRTIRVSLALVAVCAAALPTAAPALAAAGCPRTTELAMESKVMCQVCGVPLALARSLEADRERAFITTLVNRCESAAQIESAMVAQYGAGILAAPGTHGFAITAWLVPALGILAAAAGVAGIVLLPGRRRRGELAPDAMLVPASSDEERRLDAALRAYSAENLH
jgi:cytochrome c-type biogenesis protein CcmH/NrfF